MTDVKRGMAGGAKQKFLRLHREEILEYCKEHGEIETRLKYNIVDDKAWARIVLPTARQPRTFTKADRAISLAEIAQAEAIEAKRKNRELEEKFGSFVDLVGTQLTEKFFKPLLAGKIELPPELDHKPANPLDTSDFIRKLPK